MNVDELAHACTIARGLSMDGVAKAKSGHLGLPLGATEVGAVLYGHAMSYNPEEPKWLNRDRFVLSAGHGSMFLYSWLHLSGFNVPLEEVKNFRQMDSITPGHPEFGETDGVESTTGPLGQGTANAVGMAAAAKMAAAQFNTPEHTIIDHMVICLCGDGCIQEGISAEGSAWAARFGLDNLVMFYDSNDVTLDAMADRSQCEDTAQRYTAYGWDVELVRDGHDMNAILAAYNAAKTNKNGKPKLIILKTIIGKGIPEVQGNFKAHGEAGVKHVVDARKGLGLPEGSFHVSDRVKAFFAQRQRELKAKHQQWTTTFNAWKRANPDKAAVLQAAVNHNHGTADELLARIPPFPEDAAVATRASGGEIINKLAAECPMLLSGSADLHGSTKNYMKGVGDFDKDTPTGRNFYFGIREHGMGAIVNGLGYYGLHKPSGATFLVFSDYMRGAVRVASLAKLPVFFIWTHDSVGVGEDGPTHQPVESVAALRAIPNLDVIRPGDSEECAAAFAAAVERGNGPTALILTRQNIPNQKSASVETRRQGTLKGGYVLKPEVGDLKAIILASGSEVSVAMDAAAMLGDGIRVVSMPCMERFDRQSADYIQSVLPRECRTRVSVEAGITSPWYKYVGFDGKVLGIDRFGFSAPGGIVMKALGMSADAVAGAVRSLL